MKLILICAKHASSGLCTANHQGQTLMSEALRNFKQGVSISQILTKPWLKLCLALRSSKISLDRTRTLVRRNGMLGLMVNSGLRHWFSKSLIFMILKRQGILTKDKLNYLLEKPSKCQAILMNFSTLSLNPIKAQRTVVLVKRCSLASYGRSHKK